MKKSIIILLLVIANFYCTAQNQLVVDAGASLRNLAESFDKIAVSSNIKLIMSQGDQIALAVSASDEKYKDDIKTIVKNGTLHIYVEGNVKWNNRSRNNTVYLSFKDITSIKASEASDVHTLGILTLKKLEVALSGASRFSASLIAEELWIDMSGASKATCSGTVKQSTITCSGASDLNGYKLSADSASLEASGASDISITVVKELNAEASGASRIFYKGNATVTNVRVGGVSKILHAQ